MFDYLIRYSLKSRGFVLLVLVGLTASGLTSLLGLPIDAVPDITNVQVMALTDAPALGPEEIEQFVTVPVENAMNGIPFIKDPRLPANTQVGNELYETNRLDRGHIARRADLTWGSMPEAMIAVSSGSKARKCRIDGSSRKRCCARLSLTLRIGLRKQNRMSGNVS